MGPRTAWKQECRSVQVGDIGHIIYKGMYRLNAFRLCQVSEVCPNILGTVRTCIVQFRPSHTGDLSKPFVPNEPITMDVGVQRFAVLLPVE